MIFSPKRSARICLVLLLASGAAASRAEEAIRALPLAPRSQAEGTTLFTSLPPTRTGIMAENRYADPEMWGRRYQELTYGAMGTGVAIADYDNDGRPDVFVASKTEQSRLFRNLGDWRFEDVTEKAGLHRPLGWWSRGVATVSGWLGDASVAWDAASAWRQGAAFADVNNDGWVDLYLCRFGAPNLLFINQGDGTFAEEGEKRGLAMVDASGVAAFTDFDRDGWLDVYVQTNLLDAATGPHGRRDRLFHNRGDGIFVDVTDKAGISGDTAGHSATWWDYDDDGWPDLYVANDFVVQDSLYRNNRDGTFTNVVHQVLPRTPYYAMGADLGDVDNDGRIDFFVADMAGTSHEKNMRGMAGSRARAQAHPERNDQAGQYMRNALYLNTGLGRMAEIAGFAGVAASDWTWSPRFEDLDNDGRIDLHITNGMNREYHNLDLLARSMAGESPDEARGVLRSSPVMAETNLAFRNLGNLQFEPVGRAWGLAEDGVSFGSAFGDLDGDGDLDLVYSNYERAPSVLRNDSPGGGRLLVKLEGRRSNRQGIGASVRVETVQGTQVRSLVLARGYLSSSEPVLHFGLGDTSLVKRLEVRWPSGHVQVFSDLKADHRYVITEPESAPGRDLPPPAAQAGLFVASQPFAANVVAKGPERVAEKPDPLLPRTWESPKPVAVSGDVDGDGASDLLLGAAGGAPGQVLSSKSAALGKPLPSRHPLLEDEALVLVDLDRDGDLDLLALKRGYDAASRKTFQRGEVVRNDGRGGWTTMDTEAVPALEFHPGAVVAADFDGDGWTDVFVGALPSRESYPAAGPSVVWWNRGGVLQAGQTASGAATAVDAGAVSAAAVLDFDGDGLPDLVTAGEWNQVRAWRNDPGRGFVERTVELGLDAAGPGWWYTLQPGDFNGDGRPDFLAGNVGLNTLYDASHAAPAWIGRGRFLGARQDVVIEAYPESGTLHLLRTRAELATVLPGLMRKYPRNDAFARATVEEVLGAKPWNEAPRWRAVEFRSGVFLSQGGGNYAFQPLPTAAQFGPVVAATAGDLDGDGKLDLLLAQNDFQRAPFVGRFDGGVGVFAKGDGKGGFVAIHPADSGILIPGAPTRVLVTDLDADGAEEIVVVRSGAPVLQFKKASTNPR